MINFGRVNAMDFITYGSPSRKHIEIVERQRDDPSTALGAFVRMTTVSSVLRCPPSNSSTATMMELNYIIQRMAESTEDERRFSKNMDSPENHYHMWADEATLITGVEYDFDFFWNIGSKIEGLIDYMKMHFNRPRPIQLAPEYGKRIVPILPDPRTAAYPSGHSFDAWTFATILSDRHPEHADELCATAERIGLSRVIGGVHYPSDLVAGKRAAQWAVRNLSHTIIGETK